MQDVGLELKEQYNMTLERWKNYEIFVNNPDISLAEKHKWDKQAQQVVNKLSSLLEQMKKEGVVYTDTEVLEGFKI